MFFSDQGITVLNIDVASSTTATAKLVLSGTVGEKRTLVQTRAGLSQPLNFTISANSLSGPDYRTARFAGTDSGFGFQDGLGQNARFREPRGIWSDGTNLYVADQLNFTIRKIRLATGEVTTLAGKAGEPAVIDGFGSAARFFYPQSVWGDGTFLYVAEIRRIRRIRIADAHVTTFAGPIAEIFGHSDGIGDQATFSYIRGIWGDGTRLFVADLVAIRSVNLVTREVRTIAGDLNSAGYVDAVGTAARFRDVSAIWGDGTYLYVGDEGFVRKLALATNEVTTFAPAQKPDGIWGIGHRLYVLDVLEEKLKEFDLSTGLGRDLITVFPRPKGNIFPRPLHGIWADNSGNVYFADPYDHVIQKLNVATAQITTVAGKVLESTFRDGILDEARFSSPAGVWGDGENLYLADSGNHAIRKIDIRNQIVTTIAGDPNASGTEDGIGTAARFHSPTGIWGNGAELYVTDVGNENVRRISLTTAEVTTVATATRPSGISGNGQRVFFVEGLGNIMVYDAASGATATVNQLCFTLPIRFTISIYCSGGMWADPVSLNVILTELRQVSLTTGAITGNPRALTPDPAMSVGLWSDGSTIYGGVGSTVVQHSFHGFNPVRFIGDQPSFGFVEGIWGDGTTLYVTDRMKNAIHTITTAPVPAERHISIRSDASEVFQSLGSGSLATGRVSYVAESGILPFATATVSYSEGGVRVSSTAVKASKPVTTGRIPIRQGGSARTGLSITNPNSLSATINFYYTDASGQDFARGSFTIGPDQQILRFADEAPFAPVATPFGGRPDLQTARTLTFTATQPVVVAALWSQFNERGHFLMGAVPIVELPSSGSGDLYLSPIQHGSGWTSEILLLNATDNPLSGTIFFFSEGSTTTASAPMTVRVRGNTVTSFRYVVPPRSLERLQVEAPTTAALSGFATISPDAGVAPHVSVLAAVRSASGLLLHETVFEAAHPSRSNALHAESIGVSGEIPGTFEDTTLLMTNTSATTNLLVEARLWQGRTPVIRQRLNRVPIPPGTQIRITLKDLLQGQESVYAGLLRITIESPNLVVTAFRTSKNERGDLLSFAVPIFDDALPQSASGTVVPLFVNGGGYNTRLIFFAPLDLAGTGAFRLISSSGATLSLPMR
jgi:hypothetical protein